MDWVLVAIALIGPFVGAAIVRYVSQQELGRFQDGVLEAVQVAVHQQDERIRKARTRDIDRTDPGQTPAKVNEEQQIARLMAGQPIGEDWH